MRVIGREEEGERVGRQGVDGLAELNESCTYFLIHIPFSRQRAFDLFIYLGHVN